MSVRGATLDSAFRVVLPPDTKKDNWGFEVPADQPDGSVGGSARDVGSLAMFLIANWFVNGETVLIDGGVSHCHTLISRTLDTHRENSRLCSSMHPHTKNHRCKQLGWRNDIATSLCYTSNGLHMDVNFPL